MKPVLVFVFGLLWVNSISSQDSLHLSIFGKLNPDPVRYSGCWGWTDSMGHEYAIIGTHNGTSIISIDDSTNVFEVDFIPGAASNWREITVIGDHAYVVTEGNNGGMQVLDLTGLPVQVSLIHTFDSTFAESHIISKNIEGDSYVYVSGSNTAMGVHIIDITTPQLPVEIGLYNPGYYIHDCHVRGNRLYAAAIFEGYLDIVDISDRTQPIRIGRINYPNPVTHSSWTTKDHRHIFVTDETDGLPARIWNIEDINNPEQVATYSANLTSLVHNPYILDDWAFISHNTEGLRVVDIADPSFPVEVGFYDTYLGNSGGFHGLWSAFPFFPSGKIIGNNREDGLYIFTFDQVKASRIYGKIVDALTGVPVPNAFVSLKGTSFDTISSFDGTFRFGWVPEDTILYSVEVSANGYLPVVIDSLSFSQGDSLTILIELEAPTAIESKLSLPIVHTYPSPANDVVSIDLTPFLRPSYEFMVFDLQGKAVTHMFLLGSTVNQIPVNEWTSGRYFFWIQETNTQKRVGMGSLWIE